jgi:hypothetical protein
MDNNANRDMAIAVPSLNPQTVTISKKYEILDLNGAALLGFQIQV